MSDVLWRRLRYFLSPQLDLYEAIAPQVAGKLVLDVGFGTGFGTLQLARNAAGVTAIETDAAAVAFATRSLPFVSWALSDITKCPGDANFDAVVMVEVLEHIQDWETALANVCSALKPGGTLYITARNANADLRRNELHEREWTAQELCDALAKFFKGVALYDATLTRPQKTSTRMTPLIAVATK